MSGSPKHSSSAVRHQQGSNTLPPPGSSLRVSSGRRANGGSGRRASNMAGGGPPRSPQMPVGSGRRVNFDEKAAAYGSGRRFQGLSDSQISATHSAVSINSLFSEARREIRRGHAHDRKGSTFEHQPIGIQIDGENIRGVSPRAAVGDEESQIEKEPFTWQSDLGAFKEMLQEEPVLTTMLLCIPLGFIAYFTRFGGDSAIFILNFIAIIPLAWLLGNATEELAMRSNQTVGGLLNATFGNAVELIVSVVALRKGMIKLVQTSLLGSILSNSLLVLGMSFFLGGLKNKVQVYNQKGANMLSSLLLLASISLVLPAAFVNSFQPHPTMAVLLMISRLTALLMFIIYLLYLFFQLYTHSEMFDDAEKEDGGDDVVSPLAADKAAAKRKNVNFTGASDSESDGTTLGLGGRSYQAGNASEEDVVQAVGDNMNELADLAESDRESETIDEEEEEEEDDEPSMSLAASLTLLVFVTVCVATCSEFLVDSINDVVVQWGMSESFVGIILIPIVGNAAEHATAVTVAMKNKMDLAIGVAIGSSTQIALFLIPFITLLGWIINQPMSLNFSSYETICLVMAVLLLNFLVKSGESNWLQGVMLMAVYVAIGVSFWFVPEDEFEKQNHADMSVTN